MDMRVRPDSRWGPVTTARRRWRPGGLGSVSYDDPHVTIVGARTEGLNGVCWSFRDRDSKRSTEHDRYADVSVFREACGGFVVLSISCTCLSGPR